MELYKIDKLLTLFYRIHYKHGLIKSIKYTTHLFYRPEKYISANTNAFKKFIYRIFAFALGGGVTLIMIPLYLILYIITAILTFIPVSFIILGLGLYYGFLPFLLKLEKNYEPKPPKKIIERSGFDVLLIPLSWGGIITRKVVNNFYQLGLNPGRRVSELKEAKESHIIEQVGLGLASVISYILFSLVFFSLFEITSFFTLSIIALVSLFIWSMLVLFVRVLGKLFSPNDFDDSEDK